MTVMRPSSRGLMSMVVLAASACSEPFEAGSSAPADAETDPIETADRLMVADGLGPLGDGEAAPVTRDLLLWLRADVGVIRSDLGVMVWADQSGHHLDARQTDATKQPRWTSTGLPPRPVVVFDDDDFLSLPAGFADFSLGVSMFAVAVTDTTAQCVDIVHLSNGVEIDDIAFGRHDGQLHYEVLDGSASGDPFPLGALTLASVVHSPNSSIALRLNGAPFVNSTFGLPSVVTRLSNVVGRSLYADCASLHGGISEVLVYGRALDTDERARVESVLQARWTCCR